jgi:trans-aconitate 2-methyltransferase
MWDPAQYLTFADQRSRPFFDLMARIRSATPGHVVDLGCGPGQLTATLADGWPGADVVGIDSSAEMIEAADELLAERTAAGMAGQLTFRIADVTDWTPDKPADVIVSNAVLQWVPGHLHLLPRWADDLAPDGWLAFQLPGNFDQPSHAILRELAAADRWRDQLAGVQFNRQSGDPAQYLDLVTEWYKGSGLRPVLGRLGEADAGEFLAAYGDRARAAYRPTEYGTVLPFRRVFVVAHRP